MEIDADVTVTDMVDRFCIQTENPSPPPGIYTTQDPEKQDGVKTPIDLAKEKVGTPG